MEVLRGVRARWPRPRGAPGPDTAGPGLSWIGAERIAVSGVPPAWAVARLAAPGWSPPTCAASPGGTVRRPGDVRDRDVPGKPRSGQAATRAGVTGNPL